MLLLLLHSWTIIYINWFNTDVYVWYDEDDDGQKIDLEMMEKLQLFETNWNK